VGIEIEEAAIPVAEPVAAACELLGLDPLYAANEGRLVAFVSPASADRVLQLMRGHTAAVGPARIGIVTQTHAGTVELRSRFGGGELSICFPASKCRESADNVLHWLRKRPVSHAKREEYVFLRLVSLQIPIEEDRLDKLVGSADLATLANSPRAMSYWV